MLRLLSLALVGAGSAGKQRNSPHLLFFQLPTLHLPAALPFFPSPHFSLPFRALKLGGSLEALANVCWLAPWSYCGEKFWFSLLLLHCWPPSISSPLLFAILSASSARYEL